VGVDTVDARSRSIAATLYCSPVAVAVVGSGRPVPELEGRVDGV